MSTVRLVDVRDTALSLDEVFTAVRDPHAGGVAADLLTDSVDQSAALVHGPAGDLAPGPGAGRRRDVVDGGPDVRACSEHEEGQQQEESQRRLHAPMVTGPWSSSLRRAA